MLISIRHVTRYIYDAPARYSIQCLRLTPPSFDGQRVLSWAIEARGIEKALRFRDCFGNIAHLVAWDGMHDETVIVASGQVETQDRVGVLRGLPDVAPIRIFLRETPKTQPDEGIRSLAGSVKGKTTLDRLHGLMHLVHERVDYRVGATTTHTSAAEALKDGVGVCQDHAHVFISAARCLGIPSRYVNGYFVTGGMDQAEAHHAWAESYVDGLGWVGFDPANVVCPTDLYVRLACGLDAAAAAPIRGSRRGAETEALDVAIEVQQQDGQQ